MGRGPEDRWRDLSALRPGSDYPYTVRDPCTGRVHNGVLHPRPMGLDDSTENVLGLHYTKTVEEDRAGPKVG